ncbi:TetR/AcrR family transcriptional regulator [Actinomadura roseirufa]|uniref:TetR/AcrR family transcriptional regulator n=1 Tax=Actinomadura roseirufa TaxID=2094049 RepID=UPI001041155C|nr:TetR/AcrR family transcriptional regulator [Actinomadura roseirufa]
MTEDDGRPMDDGLIAAAIRLFSDLGYDTVDTDMLAGASGMSADALTQYGGKRGLYEAAFDYAAKACQEYMEAALARAPQGPESAILLFDEYLNYSVANPQIAGLWMQRWMSDASDIPNMEKRFGGVPVLQQWSGRLDKVIPEDMDSAMTVRMLVWMIHNFVRGGFVGIDGHRHTAEEPQAVEQLRDHLHKTITNLARRPER